MKNSNILNALSLFIILPLLLAQNVSAGEQYRIRTCAVQETFDSGGYSYIRCGGGSGEYWLVVLKTPVDIGEQVSYQDCPTMRNFRSESLDRLFPEAKFVPAIFRAGETPYAITEAETVPPEMAPPFNTVPPAPLPSAPAFNPAAPAAVPVKAPSASQSGVYSGTDENGALVFTDDPAKAPRGGKRKK